MPMPMPQISTDDTVCSPLPPPCTKPIASHPHQQAADKEASKQEAMKQCAQRERSEAEITAAGEMVFRWISGFSCILCIKERSCSPSPCTFLLLERFLARSASTTSCVAHRQDPLLDEDVQTHQEPFSAPAPGWVVKSGFPLFTCMLLTVFAGLLPRTHSLVRAPLSACVCRDGRAYRTAAPLPS